MAISTLPSGAGREVGGVVIVDTTVWVDYFKGVENPDTDWLNTELERQRLGLTDIILCEVLQGVRDDAVAKEVERRLLTLEVFDAGGTGSGAKLPGPSRPRSNGEEDA
jgi:hypothetical protein